MREKSHKDYIVPTTEAVEISPVSPIVLSEVVVDGNPVISEVVDGNPKEGIDAKENDGELWEWDEEDQTY